MKTYEETRRGDVLRDTETGIYFPKDPEHRLYKQCIEEVNTSKARIVPFSERTTQASTGILRKLRGRGISAAQVNEAIIASIVLGDNSLIERIRETLKT